MSPDNLTPLTNECAPRAYQFVELADVQRLLADATAPLLKRIAQLEAGQDEWVSTKEALRLTGLACAATLKRERERPGTLLDHAFVGKSGRTPRYRRSAVLAYADAKAQRRRSSGLALVAHLLAPVG